MQLSIDMPIKTCMFTGHRILEEDFCEKILKMQIENVIKRGVVTFLTGMAIGFDMVASKIVLSLKRKYKHIKLIACIPCENQEKYYSIHDKKNYKNILNKVDEIRYISTTYYNGCMLKRDRYMADLSDVMISYCKKSKSGTAYTVNYFTKKYPLREKIFI